MRRLRRVRQRYAKQEAKRRKKFKQRAMAAGAAAAITLATGLGINKALANTTDHQLAVSQDADADLLANTEEVAIGYRVFKGDQNRNEIPDGVELAKRCAVVIERLPCWDPIGGAPEPNEIYRIDLTTWGTENCDICGKGMDMGGVQIVNPKLGLSYAPGFLGESFLPFMSLHYMEHGSFSFSGSKNSGRTEIARLLRVLELQYPYDPNEHQLSVDSSDLDGDLLTDTEELAAGFDLYDADQDEDLTPDGVELAKQCAEIINQLPWEGNASPGETYKLHAPQLGLEICDICGAKVNMGPAGIVNPKLGLSVDCPLIAIHYMEHGSFNYAGNVHGSGRIDVAALLKVLETSRRCGDLGTMYLPSDLNEDCFVNFADFAELAGRWLDSTKPGQNEEGEPAKASMTFEIGDCEPEAGGLFAAEQASQTRFTATAEGQYIHFEDMMTANCCPDELNLKMEIDNNKITIREIEYTPGGCFCICNYPITAALGPLEPRIYTLEVYEDMGGFIGSTTVTVGPVQ